MVRAKLLLGLAVLTGALVAFAVPAFAKYNVETKATSAIGTNHVFEAGSATVKCGEALFKYTGGIGKFTKISVAPSYTKCTAFSIASTVTVKNCLYQFGATSGKPGSASVVVTKGAGLETCEIEVVAAGACTLKILQQAPGGSVTLTNLNEKTGTFESEVKSGVTGIKYAHSGFCIGIGNGSDGKYTGTVVVKGGIVE